VTNVLVVEDSEPLGRMLAQTLSRAGHDASWVATGAAALEHAAAGGPEVAFVDMHLADMDGAELLDRLRAAAPACRVIGLSGAAPENEVARQFDAFLLKPVALDALLDAVTGK
jgi:two-component system response regulator DesR